MPLGLIVGRFLFFQIEVYSEGQVAEVKPRAEVLKNAELIFQITPLSHRKSHQLLSKGKIPGWGIPNPPLARVN